MDCRISRPRSGDPQVDHPVFEKVVADQIKEVTARRGAGTLEQLFNSGDVWTVHEDGTIS